MNKLIIAILSMVIAISSFGFVGYVGAATTNDVKFNDVNNSHWARSSIELAAKAGYVSGYPDGTFKPSNQVTRAEFLKMIVDDLALPHEVDTKVWYQPYVTAAVESGVHSEIDFKSDYNKPITRLEMARVITRALARNVEYKAYYESFKGLYNGDLPFVDYRDFKQVEVPYLALAFGAKIISGYPDLSFGMDKKATRAEAAVMLNNFDMANEVSPATFQYLNEMKEVAETGTNALTVSKLEKKSDIKKDDLTLDTKNYTAKLKRAYVIPFDGNIVSMYERKYVVPRKDLDPYYLGFQGFIVGVADVTFKKDGTRNLFWTDLYMNIEASYYDQEPHNKFGFIFPAMIDNYDISKGRTDEIVFYGRYEKEHPSSWFWSNLLGGGHELFLNRDALRKEGVNTFETIN
jgi:hypothetical protein